jgi:hypothetical protein
VFCGEAAKLFEVAEFVRIPTIGAQKWNSHEFRYEGERAGAR